MAVKTREVPMQLDGKPIIVSEMKCYAVRRHYHDKLEPHKSVKPNPFRRGNVRIDTYYDFPEPPSMGMHTLVYEVEGLL